MVDVGEVEVPVEWWLSSGCGSLWFVSFFVSRMFLPSNYLHIINFYAVVFVVFTNGGKGTLSLECSLNLVPSNLLISATYVSWHFGQLTAWPTKISMPFLSSLNNFFIRCICYFSKHCWLFWDRAQNIIFGRRCSTPRKNTPCQKRDDPWVVCLYSCSFYWLDGVNRSLCVACSYLSFICLYCPPPGHWFVLYVGPHWK